MLVSKHPGTGVRIPPPPLVLPPIAGGFEPKRVSPLITQASIIRSGDSKMVKTWQKKKKYIALCLCCCFLLSTNAPGKNYHSEHFIIYSDSDPRCVRFIRLTAEAYYKNLRERYFTKGWSNPSVNLYADADEEPLIIYCSRTQSDTRKLLNERDHKDETGYGYYISAVPAVYVHRFMDNGQRSGRDMLLRGITYHFISLNFHNPPAWFKEGLACFLSEQSQIVKGELVTGPNSRRGQILRDNIEEGLRPNIRRLFLSSTRQFYDWPVGWDFAGAFFYWLNESGQLKRYLRNVQAKGFGLSVLEETLSKPYGKVNTELLRFIKNDCYAGAYLKDGRDCEDVAAKKQAFLEALQLKPDYQAAKLELAKCYYHSGDFEKCRENLKQILNNLTSSEYRRAARLMGDTYYKRKKYPEALEHYKRAWENSSYYEYKYRVTYQIANCYYYLKHLAGARQWYKRFLNERWEPESMKACADFARKYTGRSKITTGAKN